MIHVENERKKYYATKTEMLQSRKQENAKAADKYLNPSCFKISSGSTARQEHFEEGLLDPGNTLTPLNDSMTRTRLLQRRREENVATSRKLMEKKEVSTSLDQLTKMPESWGFEPLHTTRMSLLRSRREENLACSNKMGSPDLFQTPSALASRGGWEVAAVLDQQKCLSQAENTLTQSRLLRNRREQNINNGDIFNQRLEAQRLEKFVLKTPQMDPKDFMDIPAVGLEWVERPTCPTRTQLLQEQNNSNITLLKDAATKYYEKKIRDQRMVIPEIRSKNIETRTRSKMFQERRQRCIQQAVKFEPTKQPGIHKNAPPSFFSLGLDKDTPTSCLWWTYEDDYCSNTDQVLTDEAQKKKKALALDPSKTRAISTSEILEAREKKKHIAGNVVNLCHSVIGTHGGEVHGRRRRTDSIHECPGSPQTNGDPNKQHKIDDNLFHASKPDSFEGLHSLLMDPHRIDHSHEATRALARRAKEQRSQLRHTLDSPPPTNSQNGQSLIKKYGQKSVSDLTISTPFTSAKSLASADIGNYGIDKQSEAAIDIGDSSEARNHFAFKLKVPEDTVNMVRTGGFYLPPK